MKIEDRVWSPRLLKVAEVLAAAGDRNCWHQVTRECWSSPDDDAVLIWNDRMDILRGGSTLDREGHVPPDSLVALPQIQKLADCSGVISEVPICSKIQFFLGSPRTPLGELTVLPRPPSWRRGGVAAPPKNPTSVFGPSGSDLVSTGLRV